ncbi:MAG: hypothetical protein JWO35_41 [Candidatus Saccharibacteria bacterium]|nr:hypothetical protein [Candidatus Saccharibacteria bacterium]
MFRYFGFSIGLTAAAILAAFFESGFAAAITIIILIAIEIAFSFDNAVINAKILKHMPIFWRKIFLTFGILIAVIGMRFVFPILIVMITADLSWSKVIDDALHHPATYAKHLEHAHVAIAAFGGAFLLTLTLYFLFDDARKDLWLKRTERVLQKAGGSIWLPPMIVVFVVLLLSVFAGEDAKTVLQAGIGGAVLYTAIKLFIDSLAKISGQSDSHEKPGSAAVMYTGFAAFMAFVYLEVLDASFSFDGVLGAFAITDKVILIALGLGVGAIWVRSLTVYMVDKGTLDVYKYLEHGAHYAILVLAIALLGSVFFEVPDAVTGFVGIGVIFASFISSREAIKDKQRSLGKA